MAGDKSRFTSDRRGPGGSSWADDADWAAGATEGVDVVDGGLVGRPTARSGKIPDSVASYRHIGSDDNNVHAIDSNGSKGWTYKTGGRIRSSPAIVDGVVFVGSADNNLYALNATDGSGEWTYETDDRVRSSPAVVDGVVYVGSADNSLYAINAAGGSGEWSHETGGGIYYTSPISGADGWSFINRPGRIGNTEPIGPF